MATPKQTAEGTWRIQIMVHGKRAGKTFKSEAEAIAWAERKAKNLDAQESVRAAKASDFILANMPTKLAKCLTSLPYTKDQIVRAAMPAHSKVGVYFLVLNGDVVYVGQSIDILTRIGKHQRDGKEFDSFAYILCKKEELNKTEEMYITALMPWLNFTLGHRVRNIGS